MKTLVFAFSFPLFSFAKPDWQTEPELVQQDAFASSHFGWQGESRIE